MQMHSRGVYRPSDVSHMAWLQDLLRRAFHYLCPDVCVYVYVSFPRRSLLRAELLRRPFDLGLLWD